MLMLLVGFTIWVEIYESVYPPDAADEDTTIQVPWWKQAGAITNIVFMAVFTMIELYPLLELLEDLYWPRFLVCIGAPKPASKQAKPFMPVLELVKPRASIDATLEHVRKDRQLTRVARKAQSVSAFAATTSSAVAERRLAGSAGSLPAGPRRTPSTLLGLSAASRPELGLGTEYGALEQSATAPAPAAVLGAATAPTTCAEQPEFQVQSAYQFSPDREHGPQMTFASPIRSPASGPPLLSTLSWDDPVAGLANGAAFGPLDEAPDPNADVAWDTDQLSKSAVTLHWDETASKAVVVVHLNDAQLDSELQGRQATAPEIDEAHSDRALRSTGKPQAVRASALPWRKREYEELSTLKGEAAYQWT
jgi:hypothetical protein